MTTRYVPVGKVPCELPEAIEYMNRRFRGDRFKGPSLLIVFNRCSEAHLNCVLCEYSERCRALYDALEVTDRINWEGAKINVNRYYQ